MAIHVEATPILIHTGHIEATIDRNSWVATSLHASMLNTVKWVPPETNRRVHFLEHIVS
jgi:hypothetical protein